MIDEKMKKEIKKVKTLKNENPEKNKFILLFKTTFHT